MTKNGPGIMLSCIDILAAFSINHCCFINVTVKTPFNLAARWCGSSLRRSPWRVSLCPAFPAEQANPRDHLLFSDPIPHRGLVLYLVYINAGNSFLLIFGRIKISSESSSSLPQPNTTRKTTVEFIIRSPKGPLLLSSLPIDHSSLRQLIAPRSFPPLHPQPKTHNFLSKVLPYT